MTADTAAGTVVAFACGSVARGNPVGPPATVYRWVCPYCDGTGRWAEGERCHNCAGNGLTNDAPGFEEAELTAAPRPPAVMASPCVDCAYRPGSPEEEMPERPGPETPFFCHHGLHRIGDGYVATAEVAGMPLGAMVCAGWWALANGRPLPAKAFRDPGGSDRHQAAPPAAQEQIRLHKLSGAQWAVLILVHEGLVRLRYDSGAYVVDRTRRPYVSTTARSLFHRGLIEHGERDPDRWVPVFTTIAGRNQLNAHDAARAAVATVDGNEIKGET